MLIDKLIDYFGFTEKEAKVYLSCLKLGKTRVSIIAKNANLNRITTYEILKKLTQEGIAYSSVHNDVKIFYVIPPKTLLEKHESKLELARKSLPELQLISNIHSQKAKIYFLEGVEGIRTIYEDTLNCKEKLIRNIANPQNLINTINRDFFTNYVKKRKRRNIKVKVLLPNTKENIKLKKESKTELRDVKFFDKNKYPFSNEIFLYDNKLALFSFTSLICVIIEDEEIAESIKSFWQMIWDNLE